MALAGKKIGVIGAGAMGSALCRGLIHSGAVEVGRLSACDVHADHVERMRSELGIQTFGQPSACAAGADIVVLAVKPHTISTVLSEARDAISPRQLVISIAAGVTTASIEKQLVGSVPVVRAMPNTAAQVRTGACAFCGGQYATAEHLGQAKAIFESVGNAVQVEERMMDAVTALSGSGPAYIYLVIEALVDGGVKAGLPRQLAHELATQTVLGSARMVIDTGMHPAQLKDLVATPSGTTITALAALEQHKIRAAFIEAVELAALRATELGRGS